MSAYQVGPDTVDLITSAMIGRDWIGNGFGHNVTVVVPSGTVIYTDAARALITSDSYGDRFSVACFAQGAGDVIGRELVAANVASVAARYPSDTRVDQVGGMVGYLPTQYKYRPVSRDRFADYPHALAALACFEYQSCETGERTLAELLTDLARRNLCTRIYDAAEAPWGWSREWHGDQVRALRDGIAAGLQGGEE
jgi:hypothetical protein